MTEHLPECPKSGCAACYEQGQRDALAAARIVCHYCHQPVTTDGTWLHLDATELCYEVINND